MGGILGKLRLGCALGKVARRRLARREFCVAESSSVRIGTGGDSVLLLLLDLIGGIGMATAELRLLWGSF